MLVDGLVLGSSDTQTAGRTLQSILLQCCCYWRVFPKEQHAHQFFKVAIRNYLTWVVLSEINLLCHGTNSKCWLDCFLLDWGRIHSVFSLFHTGWFWEFSAFHPHSNLRAVHPSLASSWVLSFLMLTCFIWLRVYSVTQDVPFRVYPRNSGCTYLKTLVYSSCKASFTE